MTTLLTGLAAGVMGGLMGVGGGVIMILLMVSVCKVTQHQAHGTSLVALVFTGVAGAAAYASKGAVDVSAAVALALPAMVTAHLGARSAHALAEWKLKRAFGGFFVLVSLLLLLKQHLHALSEPVTGWLGLAVLAAAGAVTGFLSGMFGVGGGSLMVPALVLLTGFEQHVAQGSALLAMVPTGVAGARAHWQLGSVVKRLLPGLIPGILVGAYLGGSLAAVLDERTLRILFAGVLIWTGVRLFRTPRPAEPPTPSSSR